MHPLVRSALLSLVALGTLASAGPAGAEHGTNPVEMSPNMFHSANRPPTPPTGPGVTNSVNCSNQSQYGYSVAAA
jgi:hypothetical protein